MSKLISKSKMLGFYIPKKSFPRKCLTVKGELRTEYEWVQIEGVPCVVVQEIMNDDEEIISLILNSFTSNADSHFKVDMNEIDEQFDTTIIDKDGFILGLNKYPEGKIHKSEFNKRANVKQIAAAIKKIPNKDLVNKLEQTLVSQGSTHAATISQYFDFISGTKKIKTTENFGDPIFNRHKRWCPPIDISFEDYKRSPSYPAPIGIRPKDFCLPSEIISSTIELIKQMTLFKNTDKDLVHYIKTHILDVYDESPVTDTTLSTLSTDNTHESFCCKWCNKVIDANLCKAEYKSSTNYIEICHRDPNDRFLPRNVYWGHGDCNRRQGGYTEEDRIMDAITLLKHNPSYLEKYSSELLSLLSITKKSEE
jgi:hypothetical protein